MEPVNLNCNPLRGVAHPEMPSADPRFTADYGQDEKRVEDLTGTLVA
jgi:hypothetical protein